MSSSGLAWLLQGLPYDYMVSALLRNISLGGEGLAFARILGLVFSLGLGLHGVAKGYINPPPSPPLALITNPQSTTNIQSPDIYSIQSTFSTSTSYLLFSK
jgi:hypothetical protein